MVNTLTIKNAKHNKDGERCSARVMSRRTIRQILDLIAEFQSRHGQKFPTVSAPFMRPGDSWNAIDSALRKDAIVQCAQFSALKAAQSLSAGSTPPSGWS